MIPELAIPACLGMTASVLKGMAAAVLKGMKAKVLGDCRVACGSSQCPIMRPKIHLVYRRLTWRYTCLITNEGEGAMKFERITVDPNVCTGKPCIRGCRFPVSRLLGLLASGETKETIQRAYPYIEPQDIDEALQYAACLAEEETVELSR